MPYQVVGLDFNYDTAGYIMKISEEDYDDRYSHRKLSAAKRELIDQIDVLISYLQSEKKLVKSLRVEECEEGYCKPDSAALCPE